MPSGYSLDLLLVISPFGSVGGGVWGGQGAESAPSGIQHVCIQRCRLIKAKLSRVPHESVLCVCLPVCVLHSHTRTHTHTFPTSVLLRCSPADRPGVLVLEVLEVLEECSMRAARCQRRRPQAHSSQSEASTGVLVLFSRETVAQLMPAPKDVIHIYPPW